MSSILEVRESDYILDIETSLDHKTIFVVCLRHVLTGEQWAFTTKTEFTDWLRATLWDFNRFIGHNIIGFDKRVLQDVWGLEFSIEKFVDTYLISRLEDPQRTSTYSPKSPHSLEAWGYRVGNLKSEFNDFSCLSPEMIKYCHQDCSVSADVFEYIVKNYKDTVSDESIRIENGCSEILAQQEKDGFKLNRIAAQDFRDDLRVDYEMLQDELVNMFEPTIVVMKTKVKTIPFNPGSRQQIADRLLNRGWKPQQLSPTGKPVVDEGSIADAVRQRIEGAEHFNEYLLLRKRIGEVTSWLEAADKETDRVHGRVIVNGAVTGRMTHSGPNMAQIPNSSAPYGPQCRALWICDIGKVLVGIDASGLELRMLAHYMQDDDYINAVVNGRKEDGTDVHTINQIAAGLRDRDTAKTFIYAWLYGAGPAKIAEIAGCSVAEAKKLIARFLEKVPALAALKKKVAAHAQKGWIGGLDGRRIRIRSEHAALNSLLQGGGAVVMKKALLLFKQMLLTAGINHKFVANVHDEWQLECYSDDADTVGRMGKDAIKTAGVYFKLRCPLDGDYKVGSNWAETH